jgi:ribonuclease Z
MTFSLTILGSSSALPTPERFSTAQVLNVLERFFLIDCGEGTQIQLRRFKIKFTRINHIFISHLHGDHFLGLFGVISSLNLLDRKNTLHIYGPARLEELITNFLSTFDRPLGYPIEFHCLKYNNTHLIFEDDKVEVFSFPLRHRIPTCGFLFREKERPRNLIGEKIKELKIPVSQLNDIKWGKDFITENEAVIPNELLTKSSGNPRSYAFVSDSVKLTKIVPVIQKVDLLYHEATYANEGKTRAKETGHSTAVHAAEIASMAQVKKLVIGHFSNRYKDLDILLNEARQVFDQTYLARDGACFEVGIDYMEE